MRMLDLSPVLPRLSLTFLLAESPFYEVAAVDLPKQKFELVAVMEGTNETSNAKFQARTSYLPQGERAGCKM